MPPMPPILSAGARVLDRVCCRAPLSDGGLSLENKPSDPRTGVFFEVCSNVLATSPLRINRKLYIVMKFADRNGSVAVLIAPERKPVGKNLPAAIALLRLANPLHRILAAKSKQRIANP